MKLLGLHPAVAVMAIAVDAMLTALDVTVVLWPVSCLVAAALVWPCYAMQKRNYLDDHETALAKAIFVGLLTAIPTPLPAVLTGGAGVVGMVTLAIGRKR